MKETTTEKSLNSLLSDMEELRKDLEVAKYERMWTFDKYRKSAPGERLVEDAISKMDMKFGDTIIDFGCGTGRASKKFFDLGFRVIGIDFAENCLDPDVHITFWKKCLWENLGIDSKFGFCTDVMEHIPPEFVDATLGNISDSVAQACYFQIATRPDVMGKLIGEKLHLTVKTSDWWKNKLEEHFSTVEVIKATNSNFISVGYK